MPKRNVQKHLASLEGDIPVKIFRFLYALQVMNFYYCINKYFVIESINISK